MPPCGSSKTLILDPSTDLFSPILGAMAAPFCVRPWAASDDYALDTDDLKGALLMSR